MRRALAPLLVLLLLPWQPLGEGARSSHSIEILEYPSPAAAAARTGRGLSALPLLATLALIARRKSQR